MEASQKANKRMRPPTCKGFCAHINLKDIHIDRVSETDGEVKYLMRIISMALLSSYREGYT
jgi:hypothetical protein